MCNRQALYICRQFSMIIVSLNLMLSQKHVGQVLPRVLYPSHAHVEATLVIFLCERRVRVICDCYTLHIEAETTASHTRR